MGAFAIDGRTYSAVCRVAAFASACLIPGSSRSGMSASGPSSGRPASQSTSTASTAAGFTTNPFNGTGGNAAGVDELGNAWTPWNPLLDQIPNVGDEFHLVKYIQRFFLESQVAVAVLSNDERTEVGGLAEDILALFMRSDP